MTAPRILFVTGAPGPVHMPPEGSRTLRAADLAAELAGSGGAGPAPQVVVFDASVADPLQAVRSLRAAGVDAHWVFLRAPGDVAALRASLQRAPLIGRHWTLLALGQPDIDAGIARAVHEAGLRARLRTTLDRANRQLAQPKPREMPAYRRLLLAEHYLDSFLAQASDAMVGLDPQLAVMHWNARASALLGIGEREALTLNGPELPCWQPGLDALLAELRGGRAQGALLAACVVGGEQRHLDLAASCVRAPDGELLGFMLVLRDVSAREAALHAERLAGIAAEESRRELARLFDLAPGFMAITRGPHHVFEMANRAWVQLFGDHGLAGMAAAGSVPELAGQAFVRLRDEVYATGRPYVARAMAVTLPHPDGQSELRYLDFVYQPIAGPGGVVTGIFCQGHDVTEHKLMQDGLLRHQAELEHEVSTRTEALRSANLALHQSQKLEAVGKLTGGVAHDFNNILQIIASNLDLMAASLPGQGRGRAQEQEQELDKNRERDRERDRTRAQARIEATQSAVRRGGKLAAQLLAFARRQPLQPVPTDLARSLADLDELLRRALGPAIDIRLGIAPGLWRTMVDRDQLENVLLNLAINARDAMAGSGRLTIELANAVLGGLGAGSGTGGNVGGDVAPGDYVLLAVSDNGCGMPQEVRERAFEPFYTTKPEGQGTGLGLSMAYGFVRQSGGHIGLYSEAGVGTTVKIFLPRSHEAAADAQPAPKGELRGGRETILVVEDDPAVQMAVVDLLGGLGYSVLAAGDAHGALALLKAGARADLLFTDVVMPGELSSRELARQARAADPDLAVLFTSGYTREAMMHGARLAPDVELLSKPYGREDLARRVRQLLDARGGNVAVPSVAAAPLRVLVVEDNEDGREMLGALLDLLGYRWHACADAETALAALAPTDLLLTDLSLPGMSGSALADLARARHPRLPVIFCSGRDLDAAALNGARLLPKPFTLDQLQQALAGAGMPAPV